MWCWHAIKKTRGKKIVFKIKYVDINRDQYTQM